MHRLVLETHSVVGNRTSDYECCLKEMSFDANMVIVLAALLCALVLALGLNSILRCAQRWCGGGGTLLAAETGLKKRELLQIPVAAYGSGEANNITATECAICLGEFKDGERVRVLPPCNHGFHVDCIDTWLLSHTSCPNCRHSLLLDQPTSA